MKKHLTNLFVGILIIILTACSATPGQSSVPDKTTVPQDTVTPSPTSTHALPTITKPQFPTLFPTGTYLPYSSATPVEPVPRNCLTIEKFNPSKTSMDGTLLLYNTEYYGFISSIDLENGGYHASPIIASPGRSAGRDFAISPNGKWLAFLESTYGNDGKITGRYLAVTNSEGTRLKLPTWSFVNVQWLIGWINDQLIALTIPGRPIGTVVTLNPFDGKVDFIPPPTSDLYDFGYGDFYSGQVLYDPSLTHVLYIDGLKWEELKYVLKDLTTQRVLWEEEFSYGEIPKWSPDGQSYALFRPDTKVDPLYSSPREYLFQVTLEGQASPLTRTQPVSPEAWSWSPNSQYIAIWLVPTDYHQSYYYPRSLNVIDLRNNSSIDYCLETEDIFSDSPPIWSPNSQYVAFPIEVNPHEWNYYWKTIIVDIQNNKAYEIMDNVVPVGWMAEP